MPIKPCQSLQAYKLRLLALWVALALSSEVQAQSPELMIELPGGVPLYMVWIEPGTFLMGEAGFTQDRATISQFFWQT